MFQLELDTIGTKNFANGPVVEKLQTSDIGEVLIKFMKFKPKSNEIHRFVFKYYRRSTEGPPKNGVKKKFNHEFVQFF